MLHFLLHRELITYENIFMKSEKGREKGKKKEYVNPALNQIRIVEIRAKDQYKGECNNEEGLLWNSTYMLRFTIHLVMVFLLDKEKWQT